MTENRVHLINCLDGLRQLPEKCANLIICDPPYFRVKGDFDFKMTWEEWLQLHEDLARECKRVLADNGTLTLWGIDRKIAYQQVIFDKYFNLLSTVVWEKPSIANEWDTRRTFPERGKERFLVYSNEGRTDDDPDASYNFQTGILHTRVMEPLVSYLIGEMEAAGLTCKMINDLTGTSMASHWFARTSQWGLPTKDKYEVLQKIFDEPYLRREYDDLRREYDDLRREYDDLRQEFETMRRPFNNHLNLTDVWRFTNGNPSTHDHDTPKPEKLTRAMILTCSRKSDLVVVPFAGSGTECAMAAKEGRRFIGFEIEQKYVDMSNERARQYLERKQLSILDMIDEE